MPATYQLISSNTLSSSAASVTFSSIPATFTDLVLRCSVRSDRAGQTVDGLRATLNNDTGSSYGTTTVQGSGSAASSQRFTSFSRIWLGNFNASTSTSNTFTSFELYIPSYTVSQNKPLSNSFAQEDNATAAEIVGSASLWVNTSAINRIDILNSTSSNFVSGSSFFLYGIKNS